MLIGITFYDRPASLITVLKKYNDKFYLVREEDLIKKEIREDLLMTEEQIKVILQNQEYIKERVEKALKYHDKMRKQEEDQINKEEEKRKNYENTYGYTDNMSPIQKGKILKVLNKQYNYYDNGEYIGSYTRKDFIKMMLDKGYTVEYKTNLKYYSKNGELKIKANEYRLIDRDNLFYEITKTEYDYAKYLLKNIVQNKVVL